MRRAFVGLAALLMVAVLAQFFLAASGAFDTAPNEESFQPHRMLGYWIVPLALLVTGVAALARMPGRLIGLSGLIAGLAVLQSVIGAIAKALEDSGGELVFGLHALSGLAIMAAAGMLVRQARQADEPVRREP